MPGRAPAPTRQNLLGLERRLERVAKGTVLLRRKREALVSELLRLARPAASARVTIAARAATAYPLLLGALATAGHTGLRALGWPGRDVLVDIHPGQVWGIPVSELLRRPPIRRTLASRGTPPPAIGPVTSAAATAFEELTELLLDAANREALLRRLAEALSRTSRQVNNLEHRLGPELRTQRGGIRQALDEREREEHLRLQWMLRHRSES